MAEVFANGTEVDVTLTSNRSIKLWNGAANSADTIDVPSIANKTVTVVSAFDNTTGDSVTATVSSNTITIDAAGASSGNTYTIQYMYL